MKQKYSFSQFLYLFTCKIRGYFLFPNARIIRFPIDVRGKKYMKVGNNFTTGKGCRIEAYPLSNEITIHIGDNLQINDYVHITAVQNITIGNNVLIASKVYISDCSHGNYSGSIHDSSPIIPPSDRSLVAKEVIIEDNVWLGEFVSVLPGVKIGQGAIIGANSVVTKDIPSNVIAVGIPAKPIKQFNFTTHKWEKIC